MTPPESAPPLKERALDVDAIRAIENALRDKGYFNGFGVYFTWNESADAVFGWVEPVGETDLPVTLWMGEDARDSAPNIWNWMTGRGPLLDALASANARIAELEKELPWKKLALQYARFLNADQLAKAGREAGAETFICKPDEWRSGDRVHLMASPRQEIVERNTTALPSAPTEEPGK